MAGFHLCFDDGSVFFFGRLMDTRGNLQSTDANLHVYPPTKSHQEQNFLSHSVRGSDQVKAAASVEEITPSEGTHMGVLNAVKKHRSSASRFSLFLLEPCSS